MSCHGDGNDKQEQRSDDLHCLEYSIVDQNNLLHAHERHVAHT
jgi:hypothetical protein